SLADRLLTGAVWQVAGGRPSDALTTEDYEAIIVPLTELLFTAAQLPRGTAAQQAVLHQLRRVGRLIELAGAPRRELRRLRSRVPMRSGAPLADGGIARPCSVIDPPSNALRAYGQVVRNLGWGKLATKMIFSHTHQPLNGAVAEASGDLRFDTTDAWSYWPRIDSDAARER